MGCAMSVLTASAAAPASPLAAGQAPGAAASSPPAVAAAVRDDVARVSASVIQELDIDNQGHANVVAAGARPAGSR